MRRCPTCRADSPPLIHFGIYLCPTCGTVDADGHKVTPPPGVLLTPASPRVHEGLHAAAPTPVADDTQPNPMGMPPPVPSGPPVMPVGLAPPRPMPAPPRPMPLELAPPRPTPAPPRPVPMEAAPPHPRTGSPDPLTVMPTLESVSRTSFVPPPPRDARELLGPDGGSGPPQILVWMLAAYFFFELGELVLARTPGLCAIPWMLGRMSLLFGMLSGRPWTRAVSMMGSGMGILLLTLVALQPLPMGIRIYTVVGIAMEVAWIYVLMRGDVVKHFAHQR